jgi:hypothetical protein
MEKRKIEEDFVGAYGAGPPVIPLAKAPRTQREERKKNEKGRGKKARLKRLNFFLFYLLFPSVVNSSLHFPVKLRFIRLPVFTIG